MTSSEKWASAYANLIEQTQRYCTWLMDGIISRTKTAYRVAKH